MTFFIVCFLVDTRTYVNGSTQYHIYFTCFSLDIDECETSNPCDKNADCVDTDSSFICTCRLGFTGNGTTCTGTHFHSFVFSFINIVYLVI